MKKLFASVLLMSLATTYAQTAAPHIKGHNHGHAKIEISAENNEVEIDFTIPSESILGFEHNPSTQAEKNLFNQAREKWEQQSVTELFTIDPSLGCKVSKTSFEHDEKRKQNKNEPAHSEIEAELKLKCDKPVANSEIKMNLKKVYPKIQTLHVELVGSKMRTFESTNDTESLTL